MGVDPGNPRIPSNYQVFGMRPCPRAVVAGAGAGVGRLPPSTLYMRVLALKVGPVPNDPRSKPLGSTIRWADTSPTIWTSTLRSVKYQPAGSRSQLKASK